MAITLRRFLIEQDTSNVAANYTTTPNTRSLSLGPMTIDNTITFTVSNNSTWIVI
jgi:hypothetical protein